VRGSWNSPDLRPSAKSAETYEILKHHEIRLSVHFPRPRPCCAGVRACHRSVAWSGDCRQRLRGVSDERRGLHRDRHPPRGPLGAVSGAWQRDGFQSQRRAGGGWQPVAQDGARRICAHNLRRAPDRPVICGCGRARRPPAVQPSVQGLPSRRSRAWHVWDQVVRCREPAGG